MPSAWDDIRRLVQSFDLRSRHYWLDCITTLRERIPIGNGEPSSPGRTRILGKAWYWIDQIAVSQLVPVLTSAWIEWTLRRRINAAKSSSELTENMRQYLQLPVDTIKESHKLELARREQFQRKAQSYLMAVTVASSFVLGFLGLATKTQMGVASTIPLALKLVLLFGVASLLMSAFSALRVIAPGEVFDLWLQARSLQAEEEEEKAHLIKIIHLNQGYSLIAAPHVRASYVGMRNGVIVLAFLLLLLIVTDGRAW